MWIKLIVVTVSVYDFCDLLCQWTGWSQLMKPTSFNYILLVSDYVVVGSDSGRIVILEYIPSKNTFEKVTN